MFARFVLAGRRVRRRTAILLITLLGVVTAACGGKAASGSQTTGPQTAVLQTQNLTPVPPQLLATLPPPTPRPGETPLAASPDTVAIDNFNFTPATIAVSAGTTVTWVNRDDVPHTVTASDRSFTSNAFESDKSFAYTFTRPGTYAYFCSIHPFMTAKVVVR